MLPPTIKQEATAHLAAMMSNYPPAPAEKDSGPLKRIPIASVQEEPPSAAEEARASADPFEAAKRKRAERFGIPYRGDVSSPLAGCRQAGVSTENRNGR